MKISAKILVPIALLLPLFFPLGGCGCGFDCNNDDNDNGNGSTRAQLTLGFSDSLPEDLSEVVIEVDSITFRRSGEDVVVDQFTIADQNLSNADTFTVNLLDYPGIEQLVVISGLNLEAATYSSVLINIVDDGINNSYVVEQANDTQKALTVSGGVLRVDGMVVPSGRQSFSVEFSLAHALQLQANGDYLLATDGMRIENNSTAATLEGEIDRSLFNTATACAEKSDPEDGNRVYLYEGHEIALDDLADVFNANSSTNIPGSAIAPFAVASLFEPAATGNWEYAFGYIPAGDYTLAFSCNTAADNSVNYDGLVIPLPVGQVHELTLSSEEQAVCDLAEGASC